jgi:hypothetical protein
MTKLIGGKKRNILAMVLLAPIFPIIFIAGWSLYWIGQSWNQNIKQLQKPTNKTLSKQDEVEFIVIPNEEQIITN